MGQYFEFAMFSISYSMILSYRQIQYKAHIQIVRHKMINDIILKLQGEPKTLLLSSLIGL